MAIKLSKPTWGFLLALTGFALLKFVVPIEGTMATVVLLALEIGAIFTLTQDWWRSQEDKTTKHWR